MIETLWTLPGPTRLVRDIVEAVESGRSVVVVKPRAVRLDGLHRALRDRVDRDWVTLDCGQLAITGSLVQRIAAHLGVSLDGDRALVALAEALDDRIVWIAPGSDDDARALSSFIVELAAVRTRRGRGPIVCACTADNQLEPLPTAATGLAVLWWWGRVSPLDTRVVVDAAMGDRRVLGDLEAVAECCVFALDVADQLARGWTGSPANDLSSIVLSRITRIPQV